jgi:hypothetical protein
MFYFPTEGRHAVDFFRLENPGLNPRSWVPEASMLTTRPPKPLAKLDKVTYIYISVWLVMIGKIKAYV